MSEIVKVCRVHGELTLEEVIKGGTKRNGKKAYKCKICSRILKNYYYKHNSKTKESLLKYRKNHLDMCKKINRKSYYKNIEKNRKTARDYASKNFEKVKIIQKEYRKKNRKMIGNKYKEVMKKYKENLEDPYINTLLSRQTILGQKIRIKVADIPNSLRETKRILILLKKEIQKIKKY